MTYWQAYCATEQNIILFHFHLLARLSMSVRLTCHRLKTEKQRFIEIKLLLLSVRFHLNSKHFHCKWFNTIDWIDEALALKSIIFVDLMECVISWKFNIKRLANKNMNFWKMKSERQSVEKKGDKWQQRTRNRRKKKQKKMKMSVALKGKYRSVSILIKRGSALETPLSLIWKWHAKVNFFLSFFTISVNEREQWNS